MDAGEQPTMANPSWLQFTRAGSPLRCPEQTVRKEICSVEQRDGFTVYKCEEHLERFRLCADGQREMVESTTSTSIRPYGNEALCSSSGRTREIPQAAMPVINATLGQMLDDFFQYAAEMQLGLEQEGVDVAAHAPGRSWQSPNVASSRLPSLQEGGAGIFSWWQRKKENAASHGSNSVQPSLQQLVRELSSDSAVLEI